MIDTLKISRPCRAILLTTAMIAASSAATLVDVDFEFLTVDNPDGLDDGDRIQDVSGSGYHGFWGQTGSNVPIVATPGGTGVDNTLTTGKVFLRDNLGGIPDAWDGGTSTTSPYFNLDGGTGGTGAFTLEAVVNWNGTASSRNGLMGQTGGNQLWVRESGGFLQYAVGREGVKDANIFSNSINISTAKADGLWHHLALVYDGAAGEIRTYLDHQLVHTNTDPDIGDLGTLLSSTGDFFLGAYNAASADHFNGIQDRYRISDVALDVAEFLPLPGNPEGREITWTGATSAIWDINTTDNWTLNSDNSATAFQQLDNLTFNDTGANPSITISAAGESLDAGGLLFDHSSVNYSLSGDAVGGAAQLIKRGTGTLTLTNSNTYLLGTTVEAGAVVAGDGADAGEIGAGPIDIAAGASLTINRSGALDYSGGNTTAGGSKLATLSGAGELVVDGGVDILINPGNGSDLAFDLNNSWAEFTGTVTVKGGSTLQSRRNGRSAFGAGVVVLGDATTSGSIAQQLGSWTFSTDINLVGPDNQIINNSLGAFTERFNKYQGVISGSGNVTIIDAVGTMLNSDRGFILTGDSNPTGIITIANATPLRIGGVPGDSFDESASNSGSLGSANIVNQGILTFSRTDSHTVNNTITGTGTVRIGVTPGSNGDGTLSDPSPGDISAQVVTFASSQSYEGDTEIVSGTLNVPSGQTLGSGFGFITVEAAGTLTGSGTIEDSIDVFGTLDAGDGGVGTITANGPMVFYGGSTLACDLGNWTEATADQISAQDSLEFFIDTSLEVPDLPMSIVIDPTNLTGFTETDQTFTLISSPSSIIGFDVSSVTIDDSAFIAATEATGTWAVQENIAGDAIELVYTAGVPPVTNDFAAWIGGFFIDETDNTIVGFNADPDGDGLDNGLENFFGTAPDSFNSGLNNITSGVGSVTVSHTRSNNIAVDVVGNYEWSIDLVNWNASGETVGEVTAEISSSVTDDQEAPGNDTVEVIANVTAGPNQILFLRAKASQASP